MLVPVHVEDEESQMRTYSECLPCVIRQALEGARQATGDEALIEKVLREAGAAITVADLARPSPILIGEAHRIIRAVTGNDDPYSLARAACNRSALALYPWMKDAVAGSTDPFETAVRLALAGNTIDFVVNPQADQSDLDATIREALCAPLDTRVLEGFKERAAGASRILYLGDNAGEVVFDRVLIEQLSPLKVTYVVKGAPVVNDVMYSDAEAAGLSDLVEVIDNGSDLPGTVLDDCSAEFRRRFDYADLVIAKGQGNYESLEDVDKEIFFLFKAKCQVIVRHLGCELGDLILHGTRTGITFHQIAGA